jgi:hypothetical protein
MTFFVTLTRDVSPQRVTHQALRLAVRQNGHLLHIVQQGLAQMVLFALFMVLKASAL